MDGGVMVSVSIAEPVGLSDVGRLPSSTCRAFVC